MCVHTKPKPLDTTLLTGWTVVGATLILSAVLPGWDATLVIPPLAWWAEGALGTSLALGAPLSLYATHRLQDDLTRRWRLDELGSWLTLGGWLGYTAVALLWAPTAFVHWLIATLMAAAVIARMGETRRIRAKIEAEVQAMRSREASR